MQKLENIFIEEEIADLVPKEFRDLPEGDYRLTKTESFREGFVDSGDSVTGNLSIVSVVDKPAVKVFRSFSCLIRTSPIVEVLDTTKTSITFKTEGGVYLLEWLE